MNPSVPSVLAFRCHSVETQNAHATANSGDDGGDAQAVQPCEGGDGAVKHSLHRSCA